MKQISGPYQPMPTVVRAHGWDSASTGRGELGSVGRVPRMPSFVHAASGAGRSERFSCKNLKNRNLDFKKFSTKKFKFFQSSIESFFFIFEK